MATKYVLDTHALVWYLEGNPRLGSKAKAIIDDPENELLLPVIALAEAIHIISKNRTSIKSPADLLRDIDNDPRLSVYPLTYEIVQESTNLDNIDEMHDRLIVATAKVILRSGVDVYILTKDATIVGSGAVTAVWN